MRGKSCIDRDASAPSASSQTDDALIPTISASSGSSGSVLGIGGVEIRVPTPQERRRESWRRSSRKYRAVQKREQAQARLFEEES